MLKTFLNKKNILKILITLSFVGITILAFFLADQFSKNYGKEDNKNTAETAAVNTNKEDKSQDTDSSSTDVEEDDGLVSVYMQLIDRNGNVIFDEVRKADENEVLYDILAKYHEVRAESSTYGKVIFDIDSVKTKFYSESYISILVNGKYSSFGASSIYVYDGIRVTFKEVAL